MSKYYKNFVYISILLFSSIFFASATEVKAINNPIIIDASESDIQGKQELFVTGLTTKGTEVLVYVNNEFLGEATAKKENNLLDRFYFQKFITTPKPYKVGVVARDVVTMELSSVSNIANVNQAKAIAVKPPVSSEGSVPKPSKASVSKNTNPVSIKTEPKAPLAVDSGSIKTGKSTSTGQKENLSEAPAASTSSTSEDDAKRLEDKNKAILNIKDILSPGSNQVASGSGLTDETLSKSGKLKLNLIIFIIFLIAIIAWIFWVNQELVKEKKNANGDAQEKEKTEASE